MVPHHSIMSQLMNTYMPGPIDPDLPQPRMGWMGRLKARMGLADAAGRLRAAIERRRSEAALEAEIERLASLSPHLLPDIGLDPVKRDLVEPELQARPDMPVAAAPAPQRPRASRPRAAAKPAAPAARKAPAA